MSEFRGYSYPKVMDNRLARWFWRGVFCPQDWHLWDEVCSSSEHGLFCDACGEWIEVERLRAAFDAVVGVLKRCQCNTGECPCVGLALAAASGEEEK